MCVRRYNLLKFRLILKKKEVVMNNISSSSNSHAFIQTNNQSSSRDEHKMNQDDSKITDLSNSVFSSSVLGASPLVRPSNSEAAAIPLTAQLTPNLASQSPQRTAGRSNFDSSKPWRNRGNRL